MRLDVYLFERGITRSRTEAKSIIADSLVTVNGKLATKPSLEVSDEDRVEVADISERYVSRGGLKLKCAIDSFDFTIAGKRALDVGASSGGFTDCLLRHGAISVIAVDSGINQLVDSLRRDSRVTVIENYNARFMRREDLPYVPDLAVMDVSFISATYIMPALAECLPSGADFICLIKPQFEVGRANIGKGGIVKDEKARTLAVERVVAFADSVGFDKLALVKSSIVGGDGNVEFLAHFRKR
ncbi:MAG: TlyA family RNA methyltransferase [Clostridia bacterium]|nr:TlyA family RNA methyltransferase [Clostridia bacterium]